MEKSLNQEKVMQTQRTIPYSPDAVYAAFSDPERLAKWWGPKGFTNSFEVFEFKAGGLWKFIMHGPDGTDFRNESVFQDINPGKQVVIQHVSPPHFTLSVSLLPAEGGTRILWMQEFEDPRVAAAVRHIVEPSNEENLDRLQLVLAERSGAA